MQNTQSSKSAESEGSIFGGLFKEISNNASAEFAAKTKTIEADIGKQFKTSMGLVEQMIAAGRAALEKGPEAREAFLKGLDAMIMESQKNREAAASSNNAVRDFNASLKMEASKRREDQAARESAPRG